MATVNVSFTPLTAHVRTARLVALAVARRAGVADEMLDEVRLAVGEACSRAVGVHTLIGGDQPVKMKLSDDRSSFTNEVIDVGTLDEDPAGLLSGIDLAEISSRALDDEIPDALPSGFGLAVIKGLVEDVDVVSDATSTRVRMVWPTAPPRQFA
jgi:anti-sigma regulatory factor (Ser/Thr protein kinase)